MIQSCFESRFFWPPSPGFFPVLLARWGVQGRQGAERGGRRSLLCEYIQSPQHVIRMVGEDERWIPTKRMGGALRNERKMGGHTAGHQRAGVRVSALRAHVLGRQTPPAPCLLLSGERGQGSCFLSFHFHADAWHNLLQRCFLSHDLVRRVESDG